MNFMKRSLAVTCTHCVPIIPKLQCDFNRFVKYVRVRGHIQNDSVAGARKRFMKQLIVQLKANEHDGLGWLVQKNNVEILSMYEWSYRTQMFGSFMSRSVVNVEDIYSNSYVWCKCILLVAGLKNRAAFQCFKNGDQSSIDYTYCISIHVSHRGFSSHWTGFETKSYLGHRKLLKVRRQRYLTTYIWDIIRYSRNHSCNGTRTR